MTAAANATPTDRRRLRALALALMLSLAATLASASENPLVFTKVFSPDTIGPGSVSVLTFTIDNLANQVHGESDLAFTDDLPTEIKLAAPAFVSNDCGGTLTAPDGGGTIAFVDGVVGAGQVCEIAVNVTASAPGEGPYTNTSSVLTSTAPDGGPAIADLTVDDGLPGFSKSFDLPTVPFGGRSTLTFTIDNSLNGADIGNLDFTDNLPPGMVVADPSNAATDCVSTGAPDTTVTAIPGTSVIILDASGALFPGLEVLSAEDTCTVTVDVVGGATGMLGNVADNLLADFVAAGKAAAVLEVTGFETALALEKEFIDDPVAPGGTVTLEFTVTNQDRDDAATAITFDDDLEATLGDLTATLPPTPDPPCGAGSTLTFSMGVLTLASGSLPPNNSCTFRVELTVDSMSAPGAYPNTTTAVTGDVGGSPVTGNSAGDILFVVDSPLLTKEFTDDPVAAGGTVTLEFTITNPSTSAMSAITFVDELTDNSGGLGGGVGNGFLPFPVSVTLPPVPDPPCGGSSSLALISVDTDRQGLELTGGSLAASGSPGDSCAFLVTVDIPVGLPGGTYTNTTEPISATLDDEPGTPTVVGPPATDTVVVAGAPTLTKEFTDDPVMPAGGAVTLEFNLSYDVEDGTPDATAIAFTDDLDAALTGLVAASVDSNTCAGSAVDITTDSSIIDFSGGTLTAGESCVVILTLTVPAASPGSYPNTTSEVAATVGGVAAANSAAEDDLLITPMTATKEFTGDPVIAGGTVTLTFTLENMASTTATGILITDPLDPAVLAGLTANLPPTPDPPCGAGSTLDFVGGTLSMTGGILSAGAMCSFSVPLTVPAMTPDGQYGNVTTTIRPLYSGSPVFLPPATDTLTVQSSLLSMTKEFTDDPAIPGGTATLELTLENSSATDTVTDIAFDDDLDGTLSGLVATGASLNDCGGMAAGFPTGLFEYSGGTLTPGATCKIVLDLTVPMAPLPGSVFPNTTTGVTGKVGALDVFGEPASDDLEVRLLTLSKSFDGPTFADDTAVLSFTITNLDSANAATDLAFSDDLDAVISGLEAVLPPTPDPPCGAASVAAGTSFFTLTGASLGAAGGPDDSCSFDVVVAVPDTATPGSFLNTTSELIQYGLPVAGPATAFLDIESPPTFAKAFAPDTIDAGGVSTLTFTIDNTASALAATGLDFSDPLPSPVVVAPSPNASTTCTGGTITGAAGAGIVGYTGGSVAAGASCTVSIDVTSAVGDVYVNTSGDLTSSAGNSGPASDTLTVLAASPPTFAKVFAPDTINAGDVSTLTFTIDNSTSLLAATGLGFSDPLPAAVVVAPSPNASTTCTGGTITGAAGAGVVGYTGGSVAAGASCTVSIDVTSAVGDVYVNTSGDLTSSAGNSGPASDTLTVLAASPPTFAKVFAPNPVGETFDTTLTFTIDNSASVVAADDLEFLDMLPFDLVVAATPAVVNNCGGSMVAMSGSTTISLTGGSIGPAASCTISVRINAPSPGGPLVNTTGDLTSTLGNSGTATDSLTVLECAAPNGVDFTLEDQLVRSPEVYEACKTINVKDVVVVGPVSHLRLRAGVAVILFNGVLFREGGEGTIELDPSFIP